MKKYFSGFVGALLCSSASILPLRAIDNYVCDPEHIFEMRKGGKVTLPQCTTHADLLHKEGIQGELKNGKPLLVAIIDMGFYPEFTKSLKQKGVIHPAAFSDHFILDSEEDLENVNPTQLLYNLLWNLKVDFPSKAFAQGAMQINQLNDKIARYNTHLSDAKFKIDVEDDKLNYHGQKTKKELNNILQKLNDLSDGKITSSPIDAFKSVNAHGSAVMDAIHLMVPKAHLLPIDLFRFKHEEISEKSLAFVTAQAINKAIDHGVDVINLSQNLQNTPEMVTACKRAAQKGIPLIVAAGNDSVKGKPAILKQTVQDLFDAIEGKGIRFAGAIEYGDKGAENLTSYTQLPNEKTQKHFLFGAGNNFPVRYNPTNPDQLDCGTCWTTAIITGGYALAKQVAYDNGYQASSEELLDIMFKSGRGINYKPLIVATSTQVPLRVFEQAALSVATSTRALPTKPAQAPNMPSYVIGKSLDLRRVKQTIEAKVMALNPVLKASRALPSVPALPVPVVQSRALPSVPALPVPVVQSRALSSVPGILPHGQRT